MIKFESYEDMKNKLYDPLRKDLQSMVDRNASIRISPYKRPGEHVGQPVWSVRFYSGRHCFGYLGASMTWNDVLSWCDALADVIPNAKAVID